MAPLRSSRPDDNEKPKQERWRQLCESIGINPSTVTKKDIEFLEEQRDKIKRFLDLEKDQSWSWWEDRDNRREKRGRLIGEVRECFTAWRGMMALQEENEWAKKVLAACERQGKIFDLLEKARGFAEEMESANDAETAREKGYDTYFFYLRHDIAGLPERPALSQQSVELTPDNVALFIKTECGRVKSISELPRAWKAIGELRKRLRLGQPKTTLDSKQQDEVRVALDQLNSSSEEDLRKLREKRGSIEARTEAMKAEIGRAENLHRVLKEVMTDQWFDAFDPQAESSEVKTKTLSELRDFYLEKLEEVQRKLKEAENKNNPKGIV